jgi:hypothetical protein
LVIAKQVKLWHSFFIPKWYQDPETVTEEQQAKLRKSFKVIGIFYGSEYIIIAILLTIVFFKFFGFLADPQMQASV